MPLACEQRRRRHDLTRLAVSALDDLAVEPGLLDLGADRRLADRLDGCDRGGADAVDWGDAGTGRLAVDMYGAGSAQRHPTAKLRSGQAQNITQHPEQRCVAVDIDVMCAFIDFNGKSHGALLVTSLRNC